MSHLRSTLSLITFLAILCGDFYGQALATATGPGSYITVGGGFTRFQVDYGHTNLTGGFAFVDANPEWRIGLEGEARFLPRRSAEQVAETTYMGGIRLVLWPNPHRITPYGKFLAGVGQIDLPYGYAHGSFLSYAPGLGLDIDVSDRIALRAFDLEYQHWPQFSYGSLSPYGVSTGVSVRIFRPADYPRGGRRYRR